MDVLLRRHELGLPGMRSTCCTKSSRCAGGQILRNPSDSGPNPTAGGESNGPVQLRLKVLLLCQSPAGPGGAELQRTAEDACGVHFTATDAPLCHLRLKEAQIDPSTRREESRALGSASRWSAGVLALLVFLIFALAPTLSEFFR